MSYQDPFDRANEMNKQRRMNGTPVSAELSRLDYFAGIYLQTFAEWKTEDYMDRVQIVKAMDWAVFTIKTIDEAKNGK